MKVGQTKEETIQKKREKKIRREKIQCGTYAEIFCRGAELCKNCGT